MLGLILAITISTSTLATDIEEVSTKLEVIYRYSVCKEDKDILKDLAYVEELLKYNKQKLDTSTIRNQRIETAISLYLLAVQELREYEKTNDFQHYKHSLSAKVQADDLYRNTLP